MKFIGRTKELNGIHNIIENDKQGNILIYGRRRIGKSYLIKKTIKNLKDIVINYQCKNISYENMLIEFNELISTSLHLDYVIQFTSIDKALDYLFKYDKKIILIFDEFPYLIKKIEGICSIIQSKIDLNKYNSKLKLIISGSQIDIMKNMIEYNSPLFGRFDEIIELKQHNYYEASQYYPSYSNEDKLMLYSVLGGEPLYNSLVDETKTVYENIVNLMIKENSYIEFSINYILNVELAKINSANDVLLAIATGTKKNDDLVNKSHVKSAANLNPIIQKLLKLDLIKKITPINDENNKKKTLYYLNNNALKFYYRYIYKNINKRNEMEVNEFYITYIKEDFNESYIPNVFEDITKQYLIEKNKKGLIKPPLYRVGTYWYDDKVNKKNGQFDVVSLDENGYIFYEAKYTKDLIDDTIIKEEIYQLSQININYYNLGFVSKNGFNVTNDKYIYITLSDIYKLDN